MTLHANPGVRGFLLAAGVLSTALGVLGIFLPLLPTVPFLLLAVACFARSSERLHRWLVGHRHLGPMVRGYLEGGGIPLHGKVCAVVLVWISFPASAFLVVPVWWGRALLLCVALLVTIYLIRLPTRRK